MSTRLAYLWNHPRRTGFIGFNLLVLAGLVGWGLVTRDMAGDGLSGVPNLMLGYTGMMLLVVAWVIGWAAWLIMVLRRHAHNTRAASTAAPK